MCGRYLTKDQRALERELFLNIRRWPQWEGSYNIAPSQLAPVIVATDEGNVCELMRFGLVPYFTRGTINAKVENLQTGASWRGPWQRGQRCLVLSSGIYEWHVLPDGKSKQPYLIRPIDQESFAFAGLWDSSTSADGGITRSFAIITLPASPLMAEIHNAKKREPAMLAREDCAVWLSGSADEARAALKQYPDNLLIAYPIGRRVNDPKNNDAGLTEPIEKPPVDALPFELV